MLMGAFTILRKSNGIHRKSKKLFLFSLGYLENPFITGNRSDMLERIYATLNMAIDAGYIHVSPNPKANGECSQRS